MKKTLLCLSIMAVLNGPARAETATTTETTQATTPAVVPSPEATPASTSSTDAAATTTTALPETLDCTYKIPATTTTIDTNLIMKWAEKAAEQSFTFEYSKLNAQLDALKACFTDQGWQSFDDALKKSGNLNAITTQQLVVSAMTDGQATVTENKSNEWKVTVPLQVVYQNKQQKLTQSLTVDVLVGRKISGDLGILQVLAQPKKAPETTASQPAPPPPPPTTTTTTTTTPAASNPAEVPPAAQ